MGSGSSSPSVGYTTGEGARLPGQQRSQQRSRHTQRIPSVGQSGSAPPTTRGGAHRLTHGDSHEHQHHLPHSQQVPHVTHIHQVRQQQLCDGMSDLQSQSKTGSALLDTDLGVAACPFTMAHAAMAMGSGGGGMGGGMGLGVGGQGLLGRYSSNFADAGGEEVRVVSMEGL